MSDGYKEQAASREHWDTKRAAEIDRLTRENAALRVRAFGGEVASQRLGELVDALRAWQRDAIDRIKVYINICDHQRVTGEYMDADTCVYCALDRALIDAALTGTTVQPSAGPTYRQVGVRKTHDRCDFFWWESLPEGTAVYVADTAPAPAPQPTVADLHSKRVREIMECNDPLNARDLYGPADNAAAPAPQPARSLLREATIATAPKPGSGPANLVVTRNGVPVPYQKQGVEDFKAACVRPADNAAAPAPQPWGAHILDSWECIHGRRFDAGCAECASLPGAADNGTPAP